MTTSPPPAPAIRVYDFGRGISGPQLAPMHPSWRGCGFGRGTSGPQLGPIHPSDLASITVEPNLSESAGDDGPDKKSKTMHKMIDVSGFIKNLSSNQYLGRF